ncbi:MAG: hypothetical protein JJU02_16330 [Cryomorphaceae bacterium]|nr:hypothetical protein [Cryomorphaceae bacterium]
MRQISQVPVLACIAIFFVAFFTACESDETPRVSPLKALSTHSALVVETGHYPALQSALYQNEWMQTVKDDPVWKSFLKDLSPLTNHLDSLEPLLGNRRLFFGVELTGKGKYGVLASVELIENVWNRIKPKGEISDYAGHEVIHVKQNESSLFFAQHKNVLLCSPQRVLVEDGLRRLNSDHSLDVHRGFSQIRKKANPKDHLNIYVQYAEWPAFIRGLLEEEQTDFFEEISSWTALDVHISNRDILLNGLSDLGDSLPSFLDVFSGQRNQKIFSDRVVPISATMWLNFSVSNFLKQHRQFEVYRAQKGLSRRYDELLGQYNVDFEEVFLRWIDREYGVIWMRSAQLPRHKRVAYFEVRDDRAFLEAFQPLSDSAYLEVFRGEKIFKTKSSGWLRPLLGKAFAGVESRFYWMHDNYIFFAGNKDVLSDFINDILDERTLGNSLQYRKFSAKIPDRANIQLTLLLKESTPLLLDVLPKSYAPFIKRNDKLLEHTPFVNLQFQLQDKMAYTGIYTRHQEDVEQIVKPVWSADVAGKVVAGPFLLVNHYSKQKEIAIQDDKNVLYLYGTGGNLLWRKNLPEKILGQIRQVDLYRNGKMQMVFATPRKLYVLDRNGDPVAPFPVDAPDSVTAPLGVFDYDKSRNYRFMLPCGDRVYNYDKDGKQVKGWQLGKMEGKVRRMPEHWVAGSKDYLVFVTDANKAYITDRRGDIRVKTVLDLPANNTSPYSVQVNQEEKTIQLTALSYDGKLISVLSSGKIDEVHPGRLPERAGLSVLGDQMLIYGETRVMLKDPINPIEVNIDQQVRGVPKLFSQGKNNYLAVAGSENQIFVYDTKGKLVAGFPVYGTDRMVMGQLYPSPSNYLITVTPEEKLVVYLIQ